MPKVEIKHPDKVASTGSYSAGVEIDGWLMYADFRRLPILMAHFLEGSSV